MEQIIYGTSAPHLKGSLTTTRLMLYIMISLLPAGIHGVWRFGENAGMIILLTCISAVVTEALYELVTGKPVVVKDCRTLVTALILSYCLPPSLDWYIAVTAGIVCALLIQISYHFFYRNLISPVILTRLILMFFFETQMNTYVFDGLTMATPMAMLKKGETVNTLYMILGNTGGCIGETSALLLCVGAIFLILMGIMDFRVAGMYLFAFAAFMAAFGGYGLSSYYLTAQLAGGGFMLALWYIAPAYSGIPITKDGRWIYGMILGLFTGLCRLYGSSPENLCLAILLSNLFVPLIEKCTIRRPFGVEKGQL